MIAMVRSDSLLEQSGFELPRPLIAALLWWSAAFSLLQRFRHGRGLAKSSLSEEYRGTMAWLETPASPSKGMPSRPDYASATKKCGQFLPEGLQIHDG